MLCIAYAHRTTITLFLFFISISSQAQVLISLLFGEALNTDKIEFGLTGGLNRSNFIGVPEAEGLNNFNLGFLYYQGLVDVKIADAQNVQNSSLNIYVRIPIGAGNEDKNQ